MNKHLKNMKLQPTAEIKLSNFTDDELITELEQRGRINAHHTVDVRFAHFSMKHSMRCHPDLFHCDLHTMVENCYLQNGGLSPWKSGIYIIDPKTRELVKT